MRSPSPSGYFFTSQYRQRYRTVRGTFSMHSMHPTRCKCLKIIRQLFKGFTLLSYYYAGSTNTHRGSFLFAFAVAFNERNATGLSLCAALRWCWHTNMLVIPGGAVTRYNGAQKQWNHLWNQAVVVASALTVRLGCVSATCPCYTVLAAAIMIRSTIAGCHWGMPSSRSQHRMELDGGKHNRKNIKTVTHQSFPQVKKGTTSNS